jgi:hypothetical protein
LVDRHFATEDQTMCLVEGVNGGFGQAVATQPHDVDAANPRGIAINQHVGRNVVNDAGMTTNERQSANGDVVMNRHSTRKSHLILNVDVAAQQGAVGQDDVIAQLAVVRNVNPGHEEVAVADRGQALIFGGAPIDRNMLSDHIVVADHQAGRLPPVADVLGVAS